MTQRTLKVCIGNAGLEVGTLWFEARGNREFSSFEYAESWLNHPRRFALAPSMPLNANKQFFRSESEHMSPLPPALADTTPDSWGRNIIRRDARENAREAGPLTEIDYLTAVDDFSRVGALRVREDVDGAPFLSSQPGGKHNIPPLLKLSEIGRSIASLEQQDPMTAAALKRLRQVGSALGGARPKCSVVDANNRLFIAKFTSKNDTFAVERAEVLTLNLAKKCGLATPAARLEMSDDLPVALIERFDRTKDGRLPYMSAQTMLDVPSATGHSTYADLAEAIRLCSNDPKQDMEELFKRIGFTILVSNVDDHLKNHGFLYTGQDKWRLSPMFDVNPAPERHRELKTPIADLSEPDASIDLLLEYAPYFDQDEDRAVSTIRTMAETIASSWEPMAEAAGMSRNDIQNYRPAFEHDELEYALDLGNSQTSVAFEP